MPLSSSGTESDCIFLLQKVVPDLLPESFYRGRNHSAVAQLQSVSKQFFPLRILLDKKTVQTGKKIMMTVDLKQLT